MLTKKEGKLAFLDVQVEWRRRDHPMVIWVIKFIGNQPILAANWTGFQTTILGRKWAL